MTSPDYIDPAIGLPIAGALWAVYLLPKIARHLRARRVIRKAAQ